MYLSIRAARRCLVRIVACAGILSLALTMAFDAAAGTWRFAAPQQRLFRSLLADPTETRLAVVTNLNDRLNGNIGGSWEAADYAWDGGDSDGAGRDGADRDGAGRDRADRNGLGREQPRNLEEGRPLRFRTGIHAAVFSKLRWSGATFPLETADYLIGFHADLGGDRYTGRFEYAHVSAHLADGYAGPEQAMGAMTYSREYFTLYGSYEWHVAGGSGAGSSMTGSAMAGSAMTGSSMTGSAIGTVRVYGSLRWSNHAIPDVRRWRVQGGAEMVSRPLTGSGGATRAYLACDVRLFRDGDLAVNRTVHAGLLLHNEKSRGLRLALVYHGGRSEHGQFHHLEDNYGGLGLFFDL